MYTLEAKRRIIGIRKRKREKRGRRDDRPKMKKRSGNRNITPGMSLEDINDGDPIAGFGPRNKLEKGNNNGTVK